MRRRRLAETYRRLAVQAPRQINERDTMNINLPAWVIDAGERAGKTFAQAFLAAAGVAGVGADFHSIPWEHAAEIGVVAVALSLLSSMASINVGTKGTASLTAVVQKSPRRGLK